MPCVWLRAFFDSYRRRCFCQCSEGQQPASRTDASNPKSIMFSLLNHPLVCRCCLLKQPPLYHNIHDAHLSTELMALAPQLHVDPNDGLTDVICDFCLHRLQDALDFRRKCIESEQVLQSRHEQWQRTVAAGEALALDDVLECLEREVGSLEDQAKPVAKPVAYVAPLMEFVDFSSLSFLEPANQSVSISTAAATTWDAGTLNTPHHQPATLEELHLEANQTPAPPLPLVPPAETFISSDSSPAPAIKGKSKRSAGTGTPRSLHPCMECEKKFTRNFQLKLHMISVHGLGELRYQCEVCHKSFASRHSLRYHFKSLHSTERPFSCEKCEKKFVLRTQLVSHLRTHTGESKPRIYACPKCTKSWPTKSDLRTHMRSHNPDMERPFKCDRCEKAFFTRGHLNSHILVHTGEKPYACDFCDKCYQSVGNLNNHMMRQHADIIEAELEADEC